MSKQIKKTAAILIGVIFFGTVPLLLGQAHRAIILGRIVDTSGGAVPGVEVQVVQSATNVVRTTITNESGNYEVPGLLPGKYRVEASLPGFKKAVLDDIPVTSGQRVELDLTLQVGEISESITVRSDQQILDTSSADVNTVIDVKAIGDLPIGQGAVTFLFLQVPGADAASGHGGWGQNIQPLQRAGTGTPRFNGSPSGTAEFTIDGAPNTQRGNAVPGGASAFNPTADVVQEMRVQTNTFDASVGHTGGATIDLILKSGTNDFHGGAYYYNRPPTWSANSWAANRGGRPRPDVSQYKRWGFNAGGPVQLGPLYNGKDQTFFFYGYERWEDLPPGADAISATVPRPQHLQGNFSDLLALGPQYQLYDPLSAKLAPNGRIERQPFPGNIIPTNRIHPATARVAKFFSPPSQAGTADGRNNLVYNLTPVPRKFWNHIVRIDHDLSSSHKLFGRVMYSKNPSAQWALYNNPIDVVDIWRTEERVPSLALSDVWTISPTMVADFRVSVMRHSQSTIPHKGGVSWADLNLGVESLIDSDALGFPSITVTGYDRLGHLPGFSQGFTNFTPGSQTSEVRNASAHFSKLLGEHSLKFGADIRGYFYNLGREDPLGVSFNGSFTRGPFDNSPLAPIGGALADFLLGAYASSVITRAADPANYSGYQSFYIQDDWKVSRQLTVNIGLRYDREGPPTERYDRAIAGFNFDVDSPIAAAVKANYAQNPIAEIPASQFQVRGGVLFAGVDGPREVYDADNNNFSPRIGLAYQISSNTVVRAGYGIFYIPFGQRFFAAEGAVPGFDANTFSFASLDGGLTLANRLENMFPNGVAGPQGSSLGLSSFLGQGLSIPTLTRNLPGAYNQRWQFSVQGKIGSHYKLEARYVGNRTVKMPVARNLAATPNQYLSRSPERDQATINRLSQLVPNPFRGVPGMGGSLAVSTVVSRATLLNPFPHFTSLSVQLPQGWSSYHALQVELNRQLTQGLLFQTSYTFAKTMDGLGFLNAADDVPEKVISDSHRPHIWRMSGIWELPFGKGRQFGSGTRGVAGYLISGWQVQAIAFAQSGLPVPWGNVLFRGDVKQIALDNPTPERWFNTEAGFERTPALQLGSNVRTFPSRLAGVRSEGGAGTDFSIIKNTYIGEDITAQLRLELYNAWNQHYFTGAPNTAPTSSAFGTLTASSPPRAIQLGLKFIF